MTMTVGEGPVARNFTLVLPEDPELKAMARSLNGKDAVMTGLWERKLATVTRTPRITPSTRVVLINGVEKKVTVGGRAMWVVETKVVEFIRVKTLAPAPSKAEQRLMPRADAGDR
jgi:hypothetical protein